MFDRKKYQRELKKSKRDKRWIKLDGFALTNPKYSGWKVNRTTYMSIKCDCCGKTKLAPEFYLGCLRSRLCVRKGQPKKPIACKFCFNRRVPFQTKKIDIRRQSKIKAPEIKMDEVLRSWLKKEKAQWMSNKDNLRNVPSILIDTRRAYGEYAS